MSISDQAMQYYQLIREGKSPAEAFSQAFPNGIPTAEDRARQDAKDAQKQGIGQVGGLLAGALGTSYLASHIPGWIAGTTAATTGTAAGAGAAGAAAGAGAGALGGAAGGEAGAALLAPELAPMLAPEIGAAGAAGGAAAAGGAGTAGAGTGASLGSVAGPLAFIATAPMWSPYVADAGDWVGKNVFGMNKNTLSRIWDPNAAASSGQIGRQIEGFESLPTELKASLLDAAKNEKYKGMFVQRGGPLVDAPHLNQNTGEVELKKAGDYVIRNPLERLNFGEDNDGRAAFESLRSPNASLDQIIADMKTSGRFKSDFIKQYEDLNKSFSGLGGSLSGALSQGGSPAIPAQSPYAVSRPTPENMQLLNSEQGQQLLQSLVPVRSRTSSPGFDKQGRRISY